MYILIDAAVGAVGRPAGAVLLAGARLIEFRLRRRCPIRHPAWSAELRRRVLFEARFLQQVRRRSGERPDWTGRGAGGVACNDLPPIRRAECER